MKTKTALIIDDDPYAVRLLTAALRSQRIYVVTSERALGLDALLSIYQPALVFVGDGSSALDAAAVVQLVRANAAQPVAVFLHSALAEPALDDRAQEAGANGGLVKSRSLAELTRRLEGLLPR